MPEEVVAEPIVVLQEQEVLEAVQTVKITAVDNPLTVQLIQEEEQEA